MSSIIRALLNGLIGAVACAGFGFLMFFIVTMFDNTGLIEAVAFSLVVAILCAFIGLIIGLTIGIGNLGLTGGGITGFLITLVIAAIYIFSTGSPGNYGYFLSESRIIFVVLFLPTVLTGLVTARLKKIIS